MSQKARAQLNQVIESYNGKKLSVESATKKIGEIFSYVSKEQSDAGEMTVGDIDALTAYKRRWELKPSESKKTDDILGKIISYRGESMTRRELAERVAKGELPETALGQNSTAKSYASFLKGSFPKAIAAIKKAGLANEQSINEGGYITDTGANSAVYVSKSDNPANVENLSKLAQVFNASLKVNVDGKTIFEFDSPKTRENFKEAAFHFLKNIHSKFFSQNKKQQAAPVETQPAVRQGKRKPTGIFGTLEESERELKEAFKDFGKEETPAESENVTDDEIPADKFVNVIDDSDEALARYIAEWNAAIKKTSAMPMFNPEIWTAGLKIGLVYVQRRINKFADWAKQITNTLGEESKVWQPAIWEMLKTMPKIEKFSDTQITSLAKRIGNLYDNGTTDFADIRADFVKSIGAENTKKIEPMIQATYNGVKKFFETLDAKNKKAAGKENSTENVAQAAVKKLDEIDRRAREALNAARLKDKTATENFESAIIDSNRVEVISSDYKHSSGFPSKLRKKLNSIAEKLNGKDNEGQYPVFSFESAENAQAFKKALDIYAPLQESTSVLETAKKNITEAEIENLANNALKSVGLKERTAPENFIVRRDYGFVFVQSVTEQENISKDFVQKAYSVAKKLNGIISEPPYVKTDNNEKLVSQYSGSNEIAFEFKNEVDARIFEKALQIYSSNNEDYTAEINAEIDRRAREVLKTAGLEGKSAPKEVSEFVSLQSIDEPFGKGAYRANILWRKFDAEPPADFISVSDKLAKVAGGIRSVALDNFRESYKYLPYKWGYRFGAERKATHKTAATKAETFKRALEIYLGKDKNDTLILDTRPTNVSADTAPALQEQDSNNKRGVTVAQDITEENVSSNNIVQSQTNGNEEKKQPVQSNSAVDPFSRQGNFAAWDNIFNGGINAAAKKASKIFHPQKQPLKTASEAMAKLGIGETTRIDRNVIDKIIRAAGLEDADYTTDYFDVYLDDNGEVIFSKEFKTPKEKADLQNFIKLAEILGGEYKGELNFTTTTEINGEKAENGVSFIFKDKNEDKAKNAAALFKLAVGIFQERRTVADKGKLQAQKNEQEELDAQSYASAQINELEVKFELYKKTDERLSNVAKENMQRQMGKTIQALDKVTNPSSELINRYWKIRNEIKAYEGEEIIDFDKRAIEILNAVNLKVTDVPEGYKVTFNRDFKLIRIYTDKDNFSADVKKDLELLAKKCNGTLYSSSESECAFVFGQDNDNDETLYRAVQVYLGLNKTETKKAAVKVTGDEFGEYTDIEELRDKAIQYYKDKLQGTSVFNDNVIETQKRAGKPARPESSDEALGTLPVGASLNENISQPAKNDNTELEIDRRAREALKAAGLEGKIAHTGHALTFEDENNAGFYIPDKNYIVSVSKGQNLNNGNSIVEIETPTEVEYPHGYFSKELQHNIEKLAEQFNGHLNPVLHYIPSAIDVAIRDKFFPSAELKRQEYNLHFDFPDEKQAQDFIKALQIYFNGDLKPLSKEKISETAEKQARKLYEDEEVDRRAREALKAAGLEGKIAPKPPSNYELHYLTEYVQKGADFQIVQLTLPENDLSAIEKNEYISFDKSFSGDIDNLAEQFEIENADVNPARGKIFYEFETADDAATFAKALKIFLGDKGVWLYESRKLGQSGRVTEGHQGVQSEIRAATDEGIRQEGRNSVSEGISGRERPALRGYEGDYTVTNAESSAPVRPDGTGSTSARTGAGDGVRGSTGVVQPANDAAGRRGSAADSSISSNAETLKTAKHNFRIDEDNGEIGSGGLKTKFKQNIAAIKLLKQIESEGRLATPEEQKILAQFNGWGTLANAFTTKEGWTTENEQLKEILTPEEYDAASKAITNAFYTPPEIAKTIWQGLQKLGFKGGRILDPSMGTGIFFGTMPTEISNNSVLAGVELDDLTGRIAKQLYQKSNIDIKGFQDSDIAKNFYDLAITNVPFDSGVRILSDPEYAPQQYKLHDFFFAKAMASVRPGGLVAFITAPDTMASFDSQKLRTAISGKADLIAAYKLPNTTFDKNSGTKALADIVILQKRLNPSKPSEYAQEWLEEGKIEVEGGSFGFRASKYFENHPENIIGTPVESTHFYSSLDIDGAGHDVAKELAELMQQLPENVYQPAQAQQQLIPPKEKLKNTNTVASNFSFVEENGTIYQLQEKDRVHSGVLVEVPKEHWETVKDYLPLAKAATNIMNAELSPTTTDAKLADLRKTLHKNYDNFVKKHGYINSPKNQEILGSDPNYGRTAAIEIYSAEKKGGKKSVEKAEKGPIFSKRTLSPMQEPTTADTVEDALYTSLAWRGALDFDYMEKLTGKSEAEIAKELGDRLFKNPATNLQELREEYLSGNVREKLAIAKEAAKTAPEFQRNVEALQKIQPRDLTEKEITTFLGATWIDDSYYEQFARRLNGGNTVSIRRREGKFLVIGNANDVKGWEAWKVFDTNYTLYDFLEKALNRQTMLPKTRGKVDPVKATACNNKIRELNKLFDEWIWADENRKKELLHHFNTNFNNSVARDYDGSHLSLPTVAPDVRKKLYPHQKNAIWRIMQGVNTLIAHCVGAGKTFEMVIAGRELKRIGRIRKPLYVVPNNIVEQFAKDIETACPHSKILVLDSKNLPLGKKTENETPKEYEARQAKRRTTLARIATNDWDFIVISHDMFQRLPMSAQFQEQFYNDRIQELKDLKKIINQAEDGVRYSGSAFHSKLHTLKKIATAILDLEGKRDQMIGQAMAEEGTLPFDKLGIDQIFVDECDQFKNLVFKTSKEGVAGISTTGSARAWDMYQKTEFLNQQRNGGVVFASGTPVSNTLNEIFTLMRYLMPRQFLKEHGFSSFDEWAGLFARFKDSIELNVAGGYKAVKRCVLTNLISLGQATDFMDYKAAEDLPHLERPKVVGGAKEGDYISVVVKATKTQKRMMEELVARAEKIRDGGVDPTEDNMLKITGEGRKLTIDARLLDSTVPEEEAGGKIPAVCDNVLKEYKESKDPKSTQVIFLDLGTPAQKSVDENKISEDDETEEVEILTAEDLKLYDRIKQGLIRRGIPEKEIAFVHDAGNNAKKRQALFDKFNEGEIRILIGSTQKMGAGTNFQKHLAVTHHIDVPWRPRDLEQRNGRMIRKGNLNKEVKVYIYITKDTLDSYNWERIKNKQLMISAFLKRNPDVTELEDINETSLQVADFIALGTNNPLLKERATLERELMDLRLQRSVYRSNQTAYHQEIEKISDNLKRYKEKIDELKADIKERVTVETGDAFRIKIGDTVYKKYSDAKAALEKVMNIDKKIEAPIKIGEIGGFDIMMGVEIIYNTANDNSPFAKYRAHLWLKNHGNYKIDAEKDPIRAMANFINRGIETTLVDTEKYLEEDKAKIADFEKLAKKPFEQEEELREAEIRLNELNARIQNASKDQATQNQRGDSVNAVIRDFDQLSRSESTGAENNEIDAAEKAVAELDTESSNEIDTRAKKIDEVSTFDDSTDSSSVTATDSLVDSTEDNSGVGDQNSTNAKINNPPAENVPQSENSSNEKSVKDIFEIGTAKTSALSDTESPVAVLKNYNYSVFDILEPVAKHYGGVGHHYIDDNSKDALRFEFKVEENRDIFVDKAVEVINKILKESEEAKSENLKKWADLSKEEQRRREGIFYGYKNLTIDQQNLDLLHKSYPEFTEWIDELAEIASRNITDKNIASLIDQAKKALAYYLQFESIMHKSWKYETAAKDMYSIWETQRIYSTNKPSQKSLDIQKQAEEIIRKLNFREITPSEAYDEMAKVLGKKYETAADNTEIETENDNITPDVKKVDAIVSMKKAKNGRTRIYYINNGLGGYERRWDYANVKHMLDNGTAVLARDATDEIKYKIAALRLYNRMREIASSNLKVKYPDIEKQLDSAGEIVKQLKQGNITPETAFEKIRGIFNADYSTFNKLTAIIENSFSVENKKPVDNTEFENDFENWTDEDIMNSGRQGLSVQTADGVITVKNGSRFNSSSRAYRIEYKPKSKFAPFEIRKLAEELERPDIHINKLKLLQKDAPVAFICKLANEGDNYSPEQARAEVLKYVKIFIKELKSAIEKGEVPALLNKKSDNKPKYSIVSPQNFDSEFEKLQSTPPVLVDTDISNNDKGEKSRLVAIRSFGEKYPQGVKVDTQIGEVIISKHSIKDSFAHSIYPSKVDAVMSLPEGMKNATYIGQLADFDGKPISNHYFVYPIQYKGEKHYVFCRVRDRFNERRFYVHDVFTESEIREKSNALSQTQPPTNKQVQLGGTALYKHILAEFFAQGNKNNSKRGEIPTEIGTIIDAEKLNARQAAISEFGKLMGVPVKFFKGNKKFHGAFKDGKIYLNVDSETSHDWTFWHEAFHWMAANNPALLKEISDAVGLTQKQIEKYQSATGRKDLTDAETVEEILADNMKEVASRAGLLQQVGKKNKSLVQRLISWLKSVMDKFTDFFNTPNNGLTREQKNKMYDAFGKMARTITDENGNAIFRFNNRTKNIELANGDALPNVKFSARNTDVNTDNEEIQRNIESGRAAIQKVMKNQGGKVNAAMHRDDIGDIDIFWGYAGDADKNFRNGYGIAHILARREMQSLNSELVAQIMPDVIMKGEKITNKNATRIQFNHNGYTAILSKTWQGKPVNHWLLTGFVEAKTEPSNERGEVYGSTVPTARAPLRFRRTRADDSVFNESIQQNTDNSNTKFSINASDNSFATLAEKLSKTLFGERNVRFRKQMKIALEEITDYKISSGHLENDAISVKPNAKVIRTQNAYDWENILPEVGKIVAEKLKLTPSAEMNNYIASWIVDGAPNNTSAESKKFQAAMRTADDEYREKLLDAQNKFIAWNNKSAMEKFQAIISSEREEPTLGEKFKAARAEGYAQFFEDIAPVKNLIDEIEKETGKKLLHSENPYIAFRNYKGMAGRAKMILEGNATTIKILQEAYPRIKFTGFKTLKMILDEVGASTNDTIYDEFKSYVVACHLKEIHLKNAENLKAQKKRQTAIDNLKQKLKAAKTQDEIDAFQERLAFNQKKLAELKKNFYVTSMEEKECDETISKYGKKYGAAQKDLVRFSNTMLAIIHDSGLVGKYTYEGLLDKWKNYVPLHRLFDENENLAYGDSLKTMEGSARDIIDPIQAIIESTNSFIKRAEKNKGKILLAGLVRCNGVGNLIEEVDGKKPDDRTVISFYEDGVKKYLQTDEAVVRAVNNLSPPQINWFSRFLRIGTTLVRNFMTLFNPNFAIRNLARDVQDAYLYSGKYDKDKSIFDIIKDIYQTPLATLHGIMSAYRQDEDFNEWMIHGGAQASFWSMDRNYTQATIEKLTHGRLKKEPLWTRIKDKGAQALQILQAFGEYSEIGTRIGHYKKVKEILAKQHGGKNIYEDLVTAAFESRDLMDFARGGASSRNWNVLTAFANAHLQGIDKFRRTFSLSKLQTAEGRKEFGYSVLRLMLSSVIPTIILFALNHDKDWYKKDLNDYERRSHWILGENVRVPKGMDFGIRFMSNLTEDFLNWESNNKPVKFTETFIKPVQDEIPDMLPTLLQPIIEASMNYDLFTNNPVVPRRLQNLPEHLQYDDRTPDIAKYLGEKTGYSPKKIEHILFGFTGNIGKGTMRVADTVFGDKKAALPPADWLPLVGGFFRIPYRNPKIINDYYEQLDAQTKWYNEYKLTGKKPTGFNEVLYNKFKKVQKEMRKFSKLERAAIENPSLDNAEKDRRQIAIQKKRIALVEKVMR